ncbi:hypothetical protein PIB30_050550, partial [Stylosanthes scabra]|nr:hypothetical protein [Stylosanthes scabra]
LRTVHPEPSVTQNGGHNFHIEAPINASFAATRSSLHPLRIYAGYEVSRELVEAKEVVEEVLASLRMSLGVMSMICVTWMLNGAVGPRMCELSLKIQVRFRTR